MVGNKKKIKLDKEKIRANINGESEKNCENKDYYKQSAMQPIEVMRSIMTNEQFEGFLIGNIVKYRMRAKYKGNYDKDMEKANVYSHWLKNHRKGLTIEFNNTLDKLEYLGIGMCNYDF